MQHFVRIELTNHGLLTIATDMSAQLAKTDTAAKRHNLWQQI